MKVLHQKQAGAMALEKLKRSSNYVTYRKGCLGSNIPVSEVAEKLLNGGRFEEITLE
jgi:hypothetical protein